VLNLFCFGHLTRRANHGHIGIIADIVEPAPETAAGFYISQDNHQGRFQLIETVSSTCYAVSAFMASYPSWREYLIDPGRMGPQAVNAGGDGQLQWTEEPRATSSQPYGNYDFSQLIDKRSSQIDPAG
jgi:hypothetical protein